MSSGPGIEITGDTRVFWDEDTLSIAGAFNPFHVRVNLTAALAKKNIHGFLELNYYCDKNIPIPDSSTQEKSRFHFYPDDEPDSVGKTLRSKIMLTRILLWAFDFNPANKEGPANLMIVSNSVPQDPEMIRVLQALRKRNFSILLVRSDKLDNVEYADTGDLPVENFDWLWGSLIFGDKPFIDPCETRAGSVFCSGCHAKVSIITEDEDEDE
ncbi:unnamed protein product [Eruca vesicaria subsp. sativa]|uniref:NYN domain-containing protein n=1 Tax=Eruca vesicaria subsp. sativa TaxID=29727 RepID=A0ABC8LQD3_ERUVS|nr:unnamed protein product [Eruca vesicaria subsp. sativa]